MMFYGGNRNQEFGSSWQCSIRSMLRKWVNSEVLPQQQECDAVSTFVKVVIFQE
jgi:hypothetical protein